MKQETFEEFLEREGYPEGRTQEIWEDGARRGAEWQRQQQESEQVSQKFESMLTTPASTLSIKGETKNLKTK